MPILKGYVGRTSKSKDLEKILIPGNFCAVNEVRFSGNAKYSCYQIFKVGEKGLIKNKEEVLIDVKSYRNPHMGVDEKLVVGVNSHNIIQEIKEVSLKRGGVHTGYYYNEGTFSPAGGSYIAHDSGAYISEIDVSQKSIKKKFGEYIKELELRSNSIPFVLPDQYIQVGIYNQNGAPDFFDNAANEMLEYLIRLGHTEKIPSRDEIKKAEEAFNLYSNKDWKDPTRIKYMKKWDELIKKRDLLWKEHRKTREELSELLKKSSQRNMTLSAISSAIKNHSDFGQNEEYSWFREKNEDMVKDEKREYHSIPRRIFRLYPSKFMTNVMYAVPKDESSSDYVLSILENFNEKYPDTQHIPEAKQNTKLPKHYFEKKEEETVRNAKEYVNLCLNEMKAVDQKFIYIYFQDLFHSLKHTFEQYPHLRSVNYPKIEKFYEEKFGTKKVV